MDLVTLSPEAEEDLIDIWLYIAEDSPISADRFVERIHEKAMVLAEFPDMGVERPELAEMLRSFPLDRYILFYRESSEGIELVRVLRGSKDITLAF